MVVDAARGVETRARKRRRSLDAQAGVALPGFPFDVVVTQSFEKKICTFPWVSQGFAL
tara:strand:- start:1939 stop:2112 length:174 start_codon:yes stop_codon:yes gene_type:complete